MIKSEERNLEGIEVRNAWSASEAGATARAASAILGLLDFDLELIRLGENALYRVRGADLLLRVSRPGVSLEQVARTLNLAAMLRESGVPVGEPASFDTVDQPLMVDKSVVSVWRYYDHRGTPSIDFHEFGALLKNLHDRGSCGEEALPVWDPLTTIKRRLGDVAGIGVPADWLDDLSRRANEFSGILDELNPVLTVGLIHADAHSGNVLCTEDGLVLVDLDGLCVGPRDADFAPTFVQHRRFGVAVEKCEALVRGYGLNDPLVLLASPLVRLRELYMITWLLQQYGISKKIDQELQMRVASLDDDPENLTMWHPR